MNEEEEKPFPIEFIVILLIIALANDIAEIFFDLLDFTGVGIAGEAIMVPIDLVLDFFFTGIFIWKVGFGGGTVTQYIDDLLEPFLIPGRTISVGLGIWIANNPNSAIGKVATTYTSLESGNMSGAVGEAEGAAETVEGAAAAEKGLHVNEGVDSNTNTEGISGGESKTSGGKNAAGDLESPVEGGGGEENENTPENDTFKNPLDNPVGTAGEEEFNPSEDTIQEGGGFQSGETPQEDEGQPQKVIDIASRRPPTPPKKDRIESVGEDDELPMAA